MPLRSTKERRRRILPPEEGTPIHPEIGGDGYPLPLDGVVYTIGDIGEACGMSEGAVRFGLSGEDDCLRDVSLYVAGKIFEREAEGARKRKLRGRRKILI